MHIQLDLDCDPNAIESILALISPFVQQESDDLQYPALPQALINLGNILGQNQESLSGMTWNGSNWDLIESFIHITSTYRKRMAFNRIEWAERFLDQLSQVENENRFEDEQAIFRIIQHCVEMVEQDRAGAETLLVYAHQGIPMCFSEWVQHLLSGHLSNEQIAQAHWNLIDPNRLLQILKQWQDKQLTEAKDRDDTILY